MVEARDGSWHSVKICLASLDDSDSDDQEDFEWDQTEHDEWKGFQASEKMQVDVSTDSHTQQSQCAAKPTAGMNFFGASYH